MRPIDEDTITQAVIARHAGAPDARLRELATSLVQHLHAFARDIKLTEAEWAEGVRFLGDCGRAAASGRPEVALLSDALGLTALVAAANQRKPRACTETAVALPGADADLGPGANEAAREPCYVRGRVVRFDGAPVAGARVCVGASGIARQATIDTGADGRFVCKTGVPAPRPIAHDGPVGRLLQALGRHPWRPAHLHFTITAPGGERLVTQVFRRGDPELDADAVFGVRSSLVADWVRHEGGVTPEGQASEAPFTTIDFDFVLDTTTGDAR